MKFNKKLTADDLIAQAYARRQAKKDPALHNFQAPLGYHLKGVSTLINKEGHVAQTWVKTQKSMEDPQAILDAFQIAVAERDIKVAPVIELLEKHHNEDLLTVIPIGDSHFGLLSWNEETGENFNLDIAEVNLFSAIDKLVSLAPSSDEALIVNLGDFFHADNNSARTERSGNQLDVDSRWAKVLRVGIRVMVRCIDRALEKHKKVTVVNLVGNHDNHTSLMLSLCLDHYYRNTPRVTVDISPNPFHWFEFGKCLFGMVHGDMTRPEKLPGIMAHDQAEAWGRTIFRYFLCGHVHTQKVIEYPGVLVETFRTLAARDAWHNASGYRSGRSIVCDVYHKNHGRICRHEIGISQL